MSSIVYIDKIPHVAMLKWLSLDKKKKSVSFSTLKSAERRYSEALSGSSSEYFCGYFINEEAALIGICDVAKEFSLPLATRVYQSLVKNFNDGTGTVIVPLDGGSYWAGLYQNHLILRELTGTKDSVLHDLQNLATYAINYQSVLLNAVEITHSELLPINESKKLIGARPQTKKTKISKDQQKTQKIFEKSAVKSAVPIKLSKLLIPLVVAGICFAAYDYGWPLVKPIFIKEDLAAKQRLQRQQAKERLDSEFNEYLSKITNYIKLPTTAETISMIKQISMAVPLQGSGFAFESVDCGVVTNDSVDIKGNSARLNCIVTYNARSRSPNHNSFSDFLNEKADSTANKPYPLVIGEHELEGDSYLQSLALILNDIAIKEDQSQYSIPYSVDSLLTAPLKPKDNLRDILRKAIDYKVVTDATVDNGDITTDFDAPPNPIVQNQLPTLSYSSFSFNSSLKKAPSVLRRLGSDNYRTTAFRLDSTGLIIQGAIIHLAPVSGANHEEQL